MSIGKLVVLALGLVLVSGGFGAALADWSSPEPGPAIDLVDADARRDDGSGDGLLVTEEETDEDDTAGGEPPAGAAGLPPLQPAPGAGRDETTGGNEGAPGANPVEARLAPALPAPAGAGGAADDDEDTGGGGGAGGGAGGGDDSGDSDTD
jgi:hypothetical protein